MQDCLGDPIKKTLHTTISDLPKAGAPRGGHELLRPLLAVEALETHSQKLGAGDLKRFDIEGP